MATSVIAICNRALDMLGQPPITSLTDGSKTAAACSRNYDLSRDAVLRSYLWNSASKRAVLAADATAPEWGYARRFPLPVDCLRVVDSEGDLDGAVWRREGNYILTDESAPLRIRYISAVTDPALFDALLVDCIAAHLAMSIAYQVTGTESAVQRMSALYAQFSREARMRDAQESSQDEDLAANAWQDARY